MLKIGTTYRTEITVGATNTALAMGSGTLEVFATPAMVALMERAAAGCVANELAQGSTTVGTRLEINHKRATPIGETVAATATLTEIEGRKLTFHVEASDSQGQIGEGIHERVMVDVERFLSKVPTGTPN